MVFLVWIDLFTHINADERGICESLLGSVGKKCLDKVIQFLLRQNLKIRVY